MSTDIQDQRENGNGNTSFKRKDDIIKLNEIGNLTSVIKLMIAINIVVLWYFNSTINDSKQLIEYQLRTINDLNQKIEQKILRGLPYYQQQNNTINSNIFTLSPNAVKCAACHNTDRNPLFIPTTWKIEDFIKYVRGDIRMPSNPIMPNFTEKEISAKELETIFIELIRNNQFK